MKTLLNIGRFLLCRYWLGYHELYEARDEDGLPYKYCYRCKAEWHTEIN